MFLGKIERTPFNSLSSYRQQEPGANATEIYNALANVRPGDGFVPAFQLFKKIDVNGPKAVPMYQFLRVSDRYMGSINQ